MITNLRDLIYYFESIKQEELVLNDETCAFWQEVKQKTEELSTSKRRSLKSVLNNLLENHTSKKTEDKI